MHHTLGWQIPDFDKVLKCALGDDGGDPVACIDCFWRHGEKRKPNRNKKFAGLSQLVKTQVKQLHHILSMAA